MINTLTSTPRRLILALVAAGAVGATGAGLISGQQARALTNPVPAVAQTPFAPGGALPSFAQITAQNGPAVGQHQCHGQHQDGDGR